MVSLSLPVLPKRGWLKIGDKGDEVRKMQKILRYFGFSCGKTGADSIFGKDTQQAVFDFQKKYNLKYDGEWGKECNAKAKKLLSPSTGEKMVAWAQKIEKANPPFIYKKWKAYDRKTQICPVCHHQTGKYHGWNCIGFCSAACYHGGKIKTVKCSCSGLGDDRFFTNVTLDSWRKRNGQGWDMITNGEGKGGKSIPSSKLKAGDMLICYIIKRGKPVFHHIAMYGGNGIYYDDTSGRVRGVGHGEYSGLSKRMHVTRAFRPH